MNKFARLLKGIRHDIGRWFRGPRGICQRIECGHNASDHVGHNDGCIYPGCRCADQGFADGASAVCVNCGAPVQRCGCHGGRA